MTNSDYIARYIIICIAAATAFAACKRSFEPDGKATNTNYLVVDGFINCGADSTTINLSRTVLLSQKQSIKNETGATISLESSTGVFYNFKETKPGKYQVAPLNLPLTATYRLNIKTSNGKTYQSDFVEAKVTPPIDSITYNRTIDGLSVEVNARDARGKTIYYRWTYEETWKYHAGIYSFYESTGPSIVDRFNFLYYCYRGEVSTLINLASTLKFNEDVVSKKAITFIPNRSEKLSEKYSIYVKQYALTKEAFEFWEAQRKNTEQLGGIFDPQPSELKSNIRSVSNPDEPVIGFVSISTETRLRKFILPKEVNWDQPINDHCVNLDTFFIHHPKYISYDNLYFRPGSKPIKIPVDKISDPASSEILGFTATEEQCIDCRLAGGSLTPPSFWQ